MGCAGVTRPRKSTWKRTGPSGLTSCSTSGGIACAPPGPSTTSIGDSPDIVMHSLPSCTTTRPQVPQSRRCARQSPAGRVCSSHSRLERTRRRPSGSSALSHNGQPRKLPSRSSRCASSITQGRSSKGGAVTDMLGVVAGKLGDPVARVVAVKADDRSLHCAKPTRGASGSTVATASLRPLAVGAALERRARPLAVLASS